MPQLSHTAEETKATIRLSHRYLTKPNRLHSWSSWHITKRLKRRNGRDKKATPVQWQQYNDNHNAHTEMGELWKERGGREGTNHPWERVSQELSLARKFKLKVRGVECSRHVSTAISTSAVWPQARRQGRVCTHQQLDWQTTASSWFFWLTRFKQLRITQGSAEQILAVLTTIPTEKGQFDV